MSIPDFDQTSIAALNHVKKCENESQINLRESFSTNLWQGLLTTKELNNTLHSNPAKKDRTHKKDRNILVGITQNFCHFLCQEQTLLFRAKIPFFISIFGSCRLHYFVSFAIFCCSCLYTSPLFLGSRERSGSDVSVISIRRTT
jgi:hypothetical protein